MEVNLFYGIGTDCLICKIQLSHALPSVKPNCHMHFIHPICVVHVFEFKKSPNMSMNVEKEFHIDRRRDLTWTYKLNNFLYCQLVL